MHADSEEYNDLLRQFEPLIHKTIHRLNIHQNHMDYDDFFQELQLQLVKVYQSSQGEPLTNDIERYKFTAYASKGLYWHGINLLKKKDHNSLLTMEDEKLDWLIHQHTEGDLPSESNIHIEDFFKAAQKRLSGADFELLGFIVEDSYTIQELADIFGVSRDTIYQRKKRIRERLSDIKECLI